MKLKQDSWHYKYSIVARKVFDVADDRRRVSLCEYVRALIVSTVMYMVGIPILLVGLSAILIVISYPALQFYIEINDPGIRLFSFIMWSFAGWIVFNQVRQKRLRKQFELNPWGVKRDQWGQVIVDCEPKQPSLLSSYLKALKEKVCPIMDVE